MSEFGGKAVRDTRENAINTLKSVSDICLDSSERWLELNASVARTAIAGGTAFAQSLVGGAASAHLCEIQGDLAHKMFETARGYGHSLGDIAGRAQEEITRSIVTALRAPDLATPMTGAWFEWMAVVAGTSPEAGSERARASSARKAG